MISSISVHSSIFPLNYLPNLHRESHSLPDSNVDGPKEFTRGPEDNRKPVNQEQADKTSVGIGSAQISPEDAEIVKQLKARDQQVRTHEQAHLATAGSFAQGGAQFTYQTGPDGKRYAVGGEVSIDTSPVAGNPRATIEKARQIQAAALAPAQPSAQDRQVAAEAAAMQQQAKVELAEQAHADDDSIQAKGKEELGASDIDGECALCGGKHSSDTHVEGVRHQLEETFGPIERAATAGSDFAKILDSYA